MNRSMIRFLLAKLLLIEAVLLLVPVSVTLYYRESSQVFTALFSTIGILVVLGVLGIISKPKKQRIYAKEGVLIVALCWILWSSDLMPSLRLVLALQRQEQLSSTMFLS